MTQTEEFLKKCIDDMEFISDTMYTMTDFEKSRREQVDLIAICYGAVRRAIFRLDHLQKHIASDDKKEPEQ